MASSPTVRVRLPAVLRPLAGGRAELQGEGTTVGEVLRGLGLDHPELGARLLDGEGRLRRYVTFFLNDEDVRHAGGVDAAVGEGDELTVVPAISGGAAEPAASPAAGGAPDRLRPALTAVAALAERSPGREVCGFVLDGRAGEGPEVVAVPNAAPEPARAFAMAPRDVLRILRRAEQGGRAVAAIFHSHPRGGAGLSAADVTQLTAEGAPLWPEVELWVVALERGRAAEVRAHAWAGAAFMERFRLRGPFTTREST
jgi:sulfur-carrier protein